MKKLKMIFVIAGLCMTINAPMAQEQNNAEAVKEEETPLRGPRQESNASLVTFGLFCVFAIGAVALVTTTRNKKAFSIHSSTQNDDGSYTVIIRGSSVKKLNDNPQEMHVIIRKGNCIFLKKPDFSKSAITKNEDLFVVVVNQGTKIDFLFQDELLVIDGERLNEIKTKR